MIFFIIFCSIFCDLIVVLMLIMLIIAFFVTCSALALMKEEEKECTCSLESDDEEDGWNPLSDPESYS